jgi:tripartite-type tricarboxylate transporter receptor subunit TctC
MRFRFAGPARRQWMLAVAGLLAASAMPAGAQGFPARPLKLVVPFAAGGSTDAIARLLAEKMSAGLGQAVVVDNRPGAAGAIATEQVTKSAPDGYTLLLATTSTHSILPLANPRLTFDPNTALAPVGMVARAPNVLVVSPGLAVRSVQDLVALGRSQPKALSFASSGNGAITHLVAELFNASAGIQAVHVPYKTGVQALTDLSSGQVQFQFDSIVWTLPQARAGKLRALAVTGSRRSALAPELPTVAEAGLPGFEGVTWFGLAVPAGTAREVQARLHSELQRALQGADIQERFAAQGAEPAPGTPEDMARQMREDRVKWGKVIQQAGVKFE